MRKRALIGCLIILFLVLGFVGALILYARWMLVGVRPLPSRMVLRLDVEGGLREFYFPSLFQILRRRRLTLWEIVRVVDAAAQDRRVQGLVLVVREDITGGIAKIQELRSALLRFRKAEKEIVAYAEIVDDRGYLLLSAADEITVSPAGVFLFNGISARFTSYKGLLDKLGMEVQMVQYGPYKSAADAFTRGRMTPEVADMLGWIARSLARQYETAVAQTRPVLKGQWPRLVARGTWIGESAQRVGLVDRLETWSSFERRIKEKWKGRWISASRYFRNMPKPRGRGKVTCALVFAVGPIVSGRGTPGESIGADRYVRWLEEIARDDDIRCVLIRNDSPGGSGTASDQIWAAIARVREAGKVVVVSMSDLAASGGYYISMNADRIVAQPGTITGSIGVFAGKIVIRKTLEKIGVHVDIVPAYSDAGAWSALQPMNEAQMAALREEIGQFYRAFVTKVAQSRGLTFEAVDAVAQGRIWTGEQAQKHRLVDRLGGFAEAREEILALLNKPPDTRIDWRVYPRRVPLWEVLLRGESPLLAVVRSHVPVSLRPWVQATLELRRDPVLLLMPPVHFGFGVLSHVVETP